MFVFWKVSNLEEIIFDFLGETVEETFLVHTHTENIRKLSVFPQS